MLRSSWFGHSSKRCSVSKQSKKSQSCFTALHIRRLLLKTRNGLVLPPLGQARHLTKLLIQNASRSSSSNYRTRALIAIDSMGVSRSSNKSEIMRFVFRSLQLLEIARFLVRCYHVDSSSLKLRTKNAERKAKAVRNAQTLF